MLLVIRTSIPLKIACDDALAHVVSLISHQGQPPEHIQDDVSPQMDIGYGVFYASIQLR